MPSANENPVANRPQREDVRLERIAEAYARMFGMTVVQTHAHMLNIADDLANLTDIPVDIIVAWTSDQLSAAMV